ncbi:MAG: DNA primase [Candidatus Pacebacteria bacterium CG10_big_fil_rev_8_21_14_0_10_44_54]|nr:MAG: DNA primase [Candidatus Pacebacteria bacterium CG10_big_fil_rev_8_21_14_0_10_44_54]
MSQIQTIKEATDIVAVIGVRISLQGAGAQYKGICPFHAERSPSFFVSPVLQRYKCFGCGETGDVFDFLQKFDGLSFQESLEELADAAGIELEAYQPSGADKLRADILATLAMAQQYYHYLLTEHTVGKPVRAYLRDRGVTKDIIKQFSLGASSPSWDGLIAYLHEKKKVDLKLLEQAGLVITNRGRTYDRFRARVMFPLTTHRGQVVGFSGRTLSSEVDKGAKYINSPETMVYHKSELLFGFSQLHSEIRKANSIVIVEGEFDVLASVRAHQNNVSAIKGSALTKEHVRLLRRSVKQVILALDTDAAGREATKKAIAIIQNQPEGETPLELRVATLVQGKDPADLVEQDPGLWRSAIRHSSTAYDFLITTALTQYDPKTASGKRQIMQDLVPVLQQVTHAVEREHYVQRLSKELSVTTESIVSDLRIKGPQQRMSSKNKTAGLIAPPEYPQELRVLSAFIHSPEAKLAARAEQLLQFSWNSPGTTEILQTIVKQPDTAVAIIDRQLPSDLQAIVTQWYLTDAVSKNSQQEVGEQDWKQLIARFKKDKIKQQLAEISKQLAAFDTKAELTTEEELQQRKLLEEVVLLQRLT